VAIISTNFVASKADKTARNAMKTFYNNPLKKFLNYPLACVMFLFGSVDLRKLLKNL
jgi:hypothetical protein